MSAQKVSCGVKNCHYWTEGNICDATEILITSDSWAKSQGQKPSLSSFTAVEATPICKREESCCQTFVAKPAFEAYTDGPARRSVSPDGFGGKGAKATGGIGSSIPRKESWDKVTGRAKYNGDYKIPGMLHARLLTSPYAHALIKSIDTSKCNQVPHVAVLTGEHTTKLCGPTICDRPPLAKGKVRYFGEPVAMAVAHTEADAEKTLRQIKVEYEPLPVVNSPSQALAPGAPLVHPELGSYDVAVAGVYPEPGTNIATRIQIRKGDAETAWAQCDVVVESDFSLPQSSHAPMEPRNSRAEMPPDGQILLWSATQAPYGVRKSIATYFDKDQGMVVVRTPWVGGGFGGKVSAQPDFLAALATQASGGRPVEMANTRENDLVTSPCEMGLEAHVKLGATKDGKMKAAQITFLVDTGAYSDTGVGEARSAACDCTGPYAIDNVWCDSLCVYTNHPFATSFRGFSHLELTFCIERTVDKLAYALGIEPLELRAMNAVKDGDTSPTQEALTVSNLGCIDKCIQKMKEVFDWGDGKARLSADGKVLSKGVACFWKAPNPPTDASSGVIITCNGDGSINLNFGAVEIGPGMKTTIAQIVAEKLKMNVDRVHVTESVDTEVAPLHWKTVASMTTFMVGNAALDACGKLIHQLKTVGSLALHCDPGDLDVADEKVYLKDMPTMSVDFKDLVMGYKYSDGNAVGGQIMAQGSYIMRHLSATDQKTGRGRTTPTWTVGTQAVEVEFDPKDCTYRILRAATVMDVGKVINPKTAKGVVMGGMSMGLSLASREAFTYSPKGEILDTSLRTYKMLRFGGQPVYTVDFIETPQVDGPFGARALGEHGIVGMPAALANALSKAAEVELNSRPISPETIWQKRRAARS